MLTTTRSSSRPRFGGGGGRRPAPRGRKLDVEVARPAASRLRGALLVALGLGLLGACGGYSSPPPEPPPPTPLVGVTASQHLVFFDIETPGRIDGDLAIAGLEAGEAVLGMDVVASTIYLLGSTSRLYRVDADTGVAAALGAAPFTPALDGTTFGFSAKEDSSMGPAAPVCAVTSDTGQFLLLDAETGGVLVTNRLLSVQDGVSPAPLVALANSYGSPDWVALDADLGGFVQVLGNASLLDLGADFGQIVPASVAMDLGMTFMNHDYAGQVSPLTTYVPGESVLLVAVSDAGGTGSELFVYLPTPDLVPVTSGYGRLSLGPVGTAEPLVAIAFRN